MRAFSRASERVLADNRGRIPMTFLAIVGAQFSR
jgi:hypothetical protein